MGHLTPIDLLALGGLEQDILRCLTRTPDMTVSEIATRLRHPLSKIAEVIESMIAAGQLIERLIHGRRVLQVRLSRRTASVRNLPASIVGLLEQPLDDFLASSTLTCDLDSTCREALLELGQRIRLAPEQVWSWQGRYVSQIAIVRSGLLGKVRIAGAQNRRTGYLQQGAWIGLGAALSKQPGADTLMASVESELIVWDSAEFQQFMVDQPEFGLQVGLHLGSALHQCQTSQRTSQTKIWLFDSTATQSGVSTLVHQLASQIASDDKMTNRVLVWDCTGKAAGFVNRLGTPSPASRKFPNGQLWSHAKAIDVFEAWDSAEFPPEAFLDMVLTQFFQKYTHIICDLGTTKNALAQQLHGRAHVALTLTTPAEGIDAITRRWSTLATSHNPTQKRLAVLNCPSGAVGFDPAYQFVLPFDDALDGTFRGESTLFSEACAEVYRRLSLEHTIAIFVPSTMAVDQATDNRHQVESALSFLGETFGGATSSQADGVWKSEDNSLVTEVVTIVRTFVSKAALEGKLEQVMEFAARLKQEMHQEAVAIDVDNQLILV